MKLLRLAMRGVRAFAEPTEVDFARLGEQGLFAIVGPTGAGKSTLLDGVFLALFGRSPRGEASECLAPGENEIVVRLEVTVPREGKDSVIAVERAWRWSKRGAAKGAARTLAVRVEERNEKDGAWAPIDFAGQKPDAFVRDAIVRVSMADFQQAVVLPQGKFDALLAARPSERRQLVASLFRTEHLGAPLAEVLKRREGEVKGEVERLAEAEREVFVSAADADAAKSEARKAGVLANELGAALDRAEAFVAEVRRARERCAARDAAMRALEAATRSFEEMAKDRARVAAARRAATAEGAVGDLEVAGAEAIEAEARDAEARREAAATADALRGATRELGLARAAEAREAPALGDRLAKARLAVERAEAAVALDREACALSEARARAEIALTEAARAFGAVEAEERSEADRARALSRSLDAVRVGEEERARALARVAVAERRVAELRADNARTSELAAAESEVRRAEHELDACELEARARGSASDAASDEAAARALDATRAANEVDVARRALEEARARGAAAALGASLRDGSPCPVCGAREHPGADHRGDGLLIASTERALEAALRHAEAAERARARAAEESQARAEAHRTEIARCEDGEELLVGARARLERLLSGEEIPRAVLEADAAAERSRTRAELALAALPTELGQKIVHHDETMAEAEAVASALAKRAREGEALEEKLRAVEARIAALGSSSAAKRIELDEARGKRERAHAEAAAARRVADAEAREAHALLVAVEPIRQADLFAPRSEVRDAATWVAHLEVELAALRARADEAEALATSTRAEAERWALEAREARGRKTETARALARSSTACEAALRRAGFATAAEVIAALVDPKELAALELALERVDAELARARAVLEARGRDADVEVTAASAALAEAALAEARGRAAAAHETAARTRERAGELGRRRARAVELRARIDGLAPRAERLGRIRAATAGGMLSELAAERHLEGVTRAASDLLFTLSRQRYALVRTADGAFAVSDAAHGGLVRAPSTLSGGETFLASLALALALSERIQLAGRTRFDFFFLDEGFGSLDAATLELALAALEALRDAGRVIGVISHVAAVEERMPRRLRVLPGRPRGRPRVVYEPS